LNFLAHFHLAWPDEGLVAGGLEGDFCKGPLRGQLPAGIERGVRLHRAIDAYTDGHPLIWQLRRDFPAGLRRYAGILIDLSFDHFLSKYWDRFSDTALTEFNTAVYRTLERQSGDLSEGSQRMLARMVEHNILGLYLDWETVPASAARVGQRFRRHNPLEGIALELGSARNAMEQVFLEFYPQLQEFCAGHDQLLNQSPQRVSNIASHHESI
jgi:acyl carrier protein phosphodiesterase